VEDPKHYPQIHSEDNECTKYLLVLLGEKLFMREMQRASLLPIKQADPNWANKEFAMISFGDKRLVRRLQNMATDFANQPQASIPQNSGTWAKTKGAYRFFDHPEVSAQKILAAHYQASVDRMQSQSVVLAVQDTTSLNYSTHGQTEGLGPIGNKADKTLGMLLHTTLALSPDGLALGIVQAQMWRRSAAAFGQNHKRNQRPVEQKESHRWLKSFQACVQMAKALPRSQVVNIADREGDLYELLAEAQKHPEVGVLVRAQHNRQVGDCARYLWDFIKERPVAGTVEILLPRRPGVAMRKSRFEIRFGQVMLQAPCLKEEQSAVKVWIIEARETGMPEGKAICWRLLTNLEINHLDQAVEKLRWYTCRWQIEIFHKVLKSGCAVERHQLETVQRLENVIALDMIVAWRIMELNRAARQKPAILAEALLTLEECQALWGYWNKKEGGQMMEMRQAVRWIAQLGGFLARKGDGEPGPITLWRGLHRLQDITTAWLLFKSMGNA
jgi:Transposase DNA-binding/Transposase Tn5 dimerisation domain